MYLNFSNFRGRTSAGGGDKPWSKNGDKCQMGGDWQNFRRMGGERPPMSPPPPGKKPWSNVLFWKIIFFTTLESTCFLRSAILILIFIFLMKKCLPAKNWHFRVLDSVRQRKGYLSIILSNFHAFKNRKVMMKFLVGSYTLWFSYLFFYLFQWFSYLSCHCPEKQCSDHWH